MSKEKLVIVGTGLFAEVACAYFNEYSNYEVVAYSCHRRYMEASTIYGLPICALEDLLDIYPREEVRVFVAIGYGKMNRVRQSVFEEVADKGYTFANFVHPLVKIWNSTKLGQNVFIFEDNTIQPFTSIGSNTVLWSGNHIGHHSKVGDHCFISSHVVVSGSCEIGDRVFIGVNATLRDSIKISDETLIGAGALIMKDTKAKEVCVAERTRAHKLNSEEVGF
jgi:sugar O-acyltransferase (sialic acid O-acetyltransferase NeuD family)